jgi:hypothetical protein
MGETWIGRGPSPGSDEAVAFGCKCPVDINNQGQGITGSDGKTMWWLKGDCPIHGDEERDMSEETRDRVEAILEKAAQLADQVMCGGKSDALASAHYLVGSIAQLEDGYCYCEKERAVGKKKPLFEITKAPEGYGGSGLVLVSVNGDVFGLDGSGSLHGQVDRAIARNAYSVEIVEKWLGKEESGDDFFQWLDDECQEAHEEDKRVLLADARWRHLGPDK